MYLYSLIKNIGIKNFTKKGIIFVSRKMGLNSIFAKHYFYEDNLTSVIGNLNIDWEKVPFLKLRHISHVGDYINSLPEVSKTQFLNKGEEVMNGTFKLFSYHILKSTKIDFNFDPLDNIQWPVKKHSSFFSQFDPKLGDIKRVWELNRFLFADPLLPLYHLTGNKEKKTMIKEKFLSLLDLWLVQNPFERTVSWSCSQEISIRCINLIFLFRHLELEENSETGRYFKNMLALSAKHVFKEIEYAKTQRNNHAITESTFLILFAAIFPSSKYSQKYEKKGIDTLHFCLDDQFFEDGTYIQNSITYQRFALQSIVISESIISQVSIKEKILRLLERNLVFLSSIAFGIKGEFPNYGPNDGALLFNFSGSDYRDIRSLINLLSVKVKGGPVNNQPFLLLDAVIVTPTFNLEKEYKIDSKLKFPLGGFYIIKNNIFTVLLKCGSYKNRYPSQNDMLHLDVWLRGKPLLIDSGSFEYYGRQGVKNFHYYLSTAAHNTLKIDGLDQLEKGPRFTWLSTISGKVLSSNESEIIGESDGYRNRIKGNPIHRRTIKLEKNKLEITDEILSKEEHIAELFWHTSFEGDFSRKANNFYLNNEVKIWFESNVNLDIEIIQKPVSQYYAEQKNKKTFHLSTTEKSSGLKLKTILQIGI